MANPPSSPPVSTGTNTHTLEYTIDLDDFDQTKFDFIKSHIVDDLTPMLNNPTAQATTKIKIQQKSTRLAV